MQPQELYDVFRQNLRIRRMELGFTQNELATRAGLEQPQVSELERGGTNPNLATIARLAEALDTTPSALLSSVIFEIKEKSLIPA